MKDQYVEKEFDNFIMELGFTRVSQDVGASPNFQNADYVHKENKVVIELKVLQKDFFEKGGVIDSLNTIVVNPVDINEDGIGQYEFTLPDLNREGKHDNFEEPLRRIIRKANGQLKETRKHYFSDEKSYGFVILAQVGFKQLSPEMTAILVQKLLHHEFNWTDGVVICTPYHRSKNPFTLELNPECISVTYNADPEKRKLCVEIADRWVEFLEKGGHIFK